MKKRNRSFVVIAMSLAILDSSQNAHAYGGATPQIDSSQEDSLSSKKSSQGSTPLVLAAKEEEKKSSPVLRSEATVVQKDDQVMPVVSVELENVDELGMISAQHTAYSRKVIARKMLPLGSAILTTSGALAKPGITAIIHAASGSMMNGLGSQFEPTLGSVADSVTNSMVLAHRFGHKSIAIPFIGSGIFLDRIKETDVSATKEKLAETIIRAALEARSDMEIRFITYNTESRDQTVDGEVAKLFKAILVKLQKEKQFEALGSAVQVLQGSITDFKFHKCSAIVNAANMEAEFGGGISGAIARATDDSVAIDREAAHAVSLFNARALKKFE